MENLAQLLSEFPLIKIAQQSDNHKILDFYQNVSMKEGRDKIIYEREPDYFAFLKERGQNNLVFVINDQNEIHGICAISFRTTILNGKSITVGYVGDLRIKSSKKYSYYWRKFANQFFKYSYNFSETGFCDLFYTALINTNSYSNNNFLKKGLGEIEFKEISSYHMLNYIGKTISTSFKKNLSFQFAKKSDVPIIEQFLADNIKNYQIPYEEMEYQRRLNGWHNFEISNYILIFYQKNLVAVTSVWDPYETKKIKFINGSKFENSLFKIINMSTFYKLPLNNERLKILYLNQIIFKTNFKAPLNLIRELCRFIKKERYTSSYNFISYCDFAHYNFHQGIFPDISVKIKMAIFEMKHKDRASFFTENKNICFEMALV